MAKRPVHGTMPILLSDSVADKDSKKINITTEEFVIGRALQSSFVIPDPTLSRRHCTFRLSDEQWSVTDESTTGTYVNGQKITKGSAVILKAGDNIQFGISNNWKYTFSFLHNHPHSEVPEVKRAKLNSDESLAEDIPATNPDADEDTEKIIARKAELNLELDKNSTELVDKQSRAIGSDFDTKTYKDNEHEVQNKKNELEQRILKEQEDLKQQLAQAQKLTEKLNSERAKIQAALLERDQQLHNLKKVSNQEVLVLKRKLKSMKARLAEKEKQENENERRLEEANTRTLILEEEGKKLEENNQIIMENLLKDVDEREEAAKRRLKEALENLHHDKAAIENEIKGVTMRTADRRLKTCYDNLKRRLRKDLAEEKVNTYKTGGGTSILKKIHDPKLLENVGSSLAPLNNTFDSDGTYNIIVDVVDSREVECSGASSLEVNNTRQHVPLSHISLPSTSNVPEIVTPHTSESSPMDQSQKVLCASGELKTTVSSSGKWSRRRMPPKPRPSSSETVIEGACKKRVDVLDHQLNMMKEEHKCTLRIKRLKILVLREKLKYWRNKNKEN